MFWIAGAAGILGVLLVAFGWNWERSRALARWCAVAAALLVLALPISGVAFLVGAIGAQAMHLDTTSLLVFGPAFLSLALGLSAAVLSRDWRWWAGLGVIALLLTLAGLKLLNIL